MAVPFNILCDVGMLDKIPRGETPDECHEKENCYHHHFVRPGKSGEQGYIDPDVVSSVRDRDPSNTQQPAFSLSRVQVFTIGVGIISPQRYNSFYSQKKWE